MQQAPGHRVGVLRRRPIGQQDSKLVASHSRQQIALPQARLESPARLRQQTVADLDPHHIVDLPKAVQVEVEQRSRPAGAVLLAQGVSQHALIAGCG